jgi:hypothetical protein
MSSRPTKPLSLQQSFASSGFPGRFYYQAEFSGAGGEHAHIGINRIASLSDAMHP